MSAVLTTGSQLACTHGGTVTLTNGRSALTVDSKPVLARGDVVGATVSGCSTPQSNTTKPCQSVTSLITGESTALTVGGQKVLTTNARGLTDGLTAAGPGQWSVRSAGQTNLEAT